MTPARNKRQQAERRGRLAETCAVVFLLSRFYRIEALRYKTKLGEIDIIAKQGDLVVFVEVKARKSVDEAIFAVHETAKHRIRAASDLWLSRRKDFHKLSVRYDIIAVTPWHLPVHLKDAF